METTAIFAEQVLTGHELTPMHKGCVLVAEGKIKKVISQEAFIQGDYSGCTLLDLGSRTLMPGLIECHNHVGLDARLPDHLEMMNNSECELTVTAIKALKEDLYSGVTTARCMGDRHYIDLHLRKEIRRGRVEGPNLLCAGIGMRSLHGHGFVGIPHCGVQEFRRTSRENMLRGVDLLKIFATPGMPASPGSFIPHFLTREEIRAVVEEAAGKGLPTATHCIGGQSLRDCLEEGVDVVEHAYSVSDQDIELLVKYNPWVDLTTGICLDPEREPYLSPASIRQFQETRKDVTIRLAKLIKSGVRFSLGTDANHGLLYREIEYAVELGASRLKALQGVTSNGAEVCCIGHRTGRIEEGLEADLIACEKDPLTVLNALSWVSFVMKGGEIYKSI